MKKHNLVGKVVELLPVFAGSLLMVIAIVHGAFTSGAATAIDSTALWSMVGQMLPIPGGGPVTPEIDLGSFGNGIALLCGGVLLLIGLRRKPQAAKQ